MSKDNGGQISVTILHWNRPDECISTCNAFRLQEPPLKLTVLDNNSQLSKYQLLKASLPVGIDLHRLKENKGWGAAFNPVLNEWIHKQDSEYIIVSAHDALPGQGCVKLMLEYMDSHPEVGIACPEYGEDLYPKFSPIRGPRKAKAIRGDIGTGEVVDYVHGTLTLFRRSCLAQIGLFDEKYFAYGDETEIGLRARKAGWVCAMIWGAKVVNPGTWTSGATMSYLFARNTLLMAYQFGGLVPALLRALFMLPNTVRLLLVPSQQPLGFVPEARMLGIVDFFRKRFGRPEFAK